MASNPSLQIAVLINRSRGSEAGEGVRPSRSTCFVGIEMGGYSGSPVFFVMCSLMRAALTDQKAISCF
jgi:hypothetical protein